MTTRSFMVVNHSLRFEEFRSSLKTKGRHKDQRFHLRKLKNKFWLQCLMFHWSCRFFLSEQNIRSSVKAGEVGGTCSNLSNIFPLSVIFIFYPLTFLWISCGHQPHPTYQIIPLINVICIVNKYLENLSTSGHLISSSYPSGFHKWVIKYISALFTESLQS